MSARLEGDKVNILLVDDQPDRLLSYEAVLGELGQNLVKASSGVEALGLLMQDDFAVILLDVSMPEMDGFETATMIHQHPRFEKTPIIFVTALHVTDLDRLKGYAVGAVDYVSVPVVPSILRSKVAVLVELYLKRRELQRVNRTLAQANAELAEANSTLQAEKTRELQLLNRTLENANARLEDANRTLQAEMAERERLELQLRAADRRKDEFLAMLAHELRNPLAPLRNALTSLQRHGLGEEVKAQALAMMSRQITQMSRLIDELIDISRITSDRIELRKEAVDLQTIVDDALELARPAIEGRRHRLSTDLPTQSILLCADGTRLEQVLSNLLHNAAKYTEPGGEISLSASVDDVDVTLRVRDSGIGIEPAMLSSIFDMFVQVDSSFERSQGGLGIGLTLARRLVELHGGTVTAHSDGLGHGSEFVVRLPLSTVTDVVPVSTTPAVTGPAAKCRIVIADDNADYAQSTAALLGMEGHCVHVAHDGLRTLELVESERPDVVFLDIGLPKLNGYDLARRIRQIPGMERVLLVAITGWGQRKDRELADAAGFDRHLVKPVDPDLLLQLISQRSPAPPAAGRDTARHDRVLLVDDNADVRATIADMLSDAGYEVQTAPDGHAAIELAATWRPRFVLADINMPVMNGFEVARQLRSRYPATEMKLVMMSGMTLNAALEESAARAGFDATVDKMADREHWVRVLAI